MLNKQSDKTTIKHGMLTNYSQVEQSKEITEESLDNVVELLRSQAQHYKSVGLTQVSTWL